MPVHSDSKVKKAKRAAAAFARAHKEKKDAEEELIDAMTSLYPTYTHRDSGPHRDREYKIETSYGDVTGYRWGKKDWNFSVSDAIEVGEDE